MFRDMVVTSHSGDKQRQSYSTDSTVCRCMQKPKHTALWTLRVCWDVDFLMDCGLKILHLVQALTHYNHNNSVVHACGKQPNVYSFLRD